MTMIQATTRGGSFGETSRGALAIGSLAAHAASGAQRLVEGDDLQPPERIALTAIGDMFKRAAEAIELGEQFMKGTAVSAGSVAAIRAVEPAMATLVGLRGEASSPGELVVTLSELADRTNELLAESPSKEAAATMHGTFTHLSNLSMQRLGTSGERPTTL